MPGTVAIARRVINPMNDLQHDPISYTALKVLEQRARTCSIPLCREMAEAAGLQWQSPWHRRMARRLVGGKFNSGLYLQLRFDAMTRALEAHRGWTVLELAAGLGTRGVLECPAREAYIETDLENLITFKQGVVKQLSGGSHAANHYFRAVNVTRAADMAAIGEFLGSLRLAKPVAIIHEGLLMYFSPEEQRAARDSIAALLRSHPPGGVWLTSDFSERDIDATALQKLMSLRLSSQVRRRLNYFPDDNAVQQFLQEAGLRGELLCDPLPQLDQATRAYAANFRIHRIAIR
jgi:O-methyltransferase involved in polyketide biosynthesis